MFGSILDYKTHPNAKKAKRADLLYWAEKMYDSEDGKVFDKPVFIPKPQWEQIRETYLAEIAYAEDHKDDSDELLQKLHDDQRISVEILHHIASFKSDNMIMLTCEKLVDGLKKIIKNTPKYGFFQSIFRSNGLRTNKKIHVGGAIERLQDMPHRINEISDRDLLQVMKDLVLNISTERNFHRPVVIDIEKKGKIYTAVVTLMKETFGENRVDTILNDLHSHKYSKIGERSRIRRGGYGFSFDGQP